MITEQDIFQRSELLLGSEAMGRISEKRVIIFGVGGVGSLVHITAIFGFMLAGLVILDIVKSQL